MLSGTSVGLNQEHVRNGSMRLGKRVGPPHMSRFTSLSDGISAVAVMIDSEYDDP